MEKWKIRSSNYIGKCAFIKAEKWVSISTLDNIYPEISIEKATLGRWSNLGTD